MNQDQSTWCGWFPLKMTAENPPKLGPFQQWKDPLGIKVDCSDMSCSVIGHEICIKKKDDQQVTDRYTPGSSNIAGWKMDPEWRCISYQTGGMMTDPVLGSGAFCPQDPGTTHDLYIVAGWLFHVMSAFFFQEHTRWWFWYFTPRCVCFLLGITASCAVILWVCVGVRETNPPRMPDAIVAFRRMTNPGGSWGYLTPLLTGILDS